MLTAKLLDRIKELTVAPEPHAMAPNVVQEVTYELAIEDGCSEDKANAISDAAFELASQLVASAGSYL